MGVDSTITGGYMNPTVTSEQFLRSMHVAPDEDLLETCRRWHVSSERPYSRKGLSRLASALANSQDEAEKYQQESLDMRALAESRRLECYIETLRTVRWRIRARAWRCAAVLLGIALAAMLVRRWM